jgi:putative intracellular protease/amidase
VPGTAADVFAFTDEPNPRVPDGPTLVQPARRKTGRSSRWSGRQKLAAGLAALALVVGIAVAARPGKNSTPPNPDGEKSAAKVTDPPTKTTPGKAPPDAARGPNPLRRDELPKLLLVLPERGLWYPDYQKVKLAFEKCGGKVVTAAAGPGPALSVDDPNNSGPPVKIEVRLTEDMDLSDYAAVAFTGKDVSEYVGDTPGGRAAQAVMRRMCEANRYVCGVCVGQKVLAAAGALRNRKAAYNALVAREFPTAGTGIDWQQVGVVFDGHVVTAAYDWSSQKFAAELMDAIRKK